MDKWIEGWVDVWMDGGVAGSLPGWLTGWMDVWMHLRILIWKLYGKQDSIRKKLKMKKNGYIHHYYCDARHNKAKSECNIQ